MGRAAYYLGLLGVGVLPLTVLSVWAATQKTAPETPVQVSYNHLPLSFEANRGQTDPQVKFLSHSGSYTLFLTATEAVLAFHQPVTPQSRYPTVVSSKSNHTTFVHSYGNR